MFLLRADWPSHGSRFLQGHYQKSSTEFHFGNPAVFLSLENAITPHASSAQELYLSSSYYIGSNCFRCCSVHVFLFEDLHAQGNKGEESSCLLKRTLADSLLDSHFQIRNRQVIGSEKARRSRSRRNTSKHTIYFLCLFLLSGWAPRLPPASTPATSLSYKAATLS